MACALAKWKKLNETPSSGLWPLQPGHTWSPDYQGPYSVEAVGGFIGMFTFVCLSTGYGVVFLVRSKTEHFACAEKIDTLCNRWGHFLLFFEWTLGVLRILILLLSSVHESMD